MKALLYVTFKCSGYCCFLMAGAAVATEKSAMGFSLGALLSLVGHLSICAAEEIGRL